MRVQNISKVIGVKVYAVKATGKDCSSERIY
jgi:hypothetical protein